MKIKKHTVSKGTYNGIPTKLNIFKFEGGKRLVVSDNPNHEKVALVKGDGRKASFQTFPQQEADFAFNKIKHLLK